MLGALHYITLFCHAFCSIDCLTDLSVDRPPLCQTEGSTVRPTHNPPTVQPSDPPTDTLPIDRPLNRPTSDLAIDRLIDRPTYILTNSPTLQPTSRPFDLLTIRPTIQLTIQPSYPPICRLTLRLTVLSINQPKLQNQPSLH